VSGLDFGRELRKVPGRERIAGVCAGIAYWLGLEIWLIRLVFLILLFANGVGLVIYVLLWIALDDWKTTPKDFDELTR